MMHSGKMSLCKLKSFQAQAIADYVNSGILTCCVEPSEEERSQVDIEAFKKQLPNSYPYEEWFDDSFTVFSRTIRWQGDILVPDYACAGLFIFQHWSQLTETDIHAIFHLDKTLELIHSEMASRNHDDVPEQPDDTDIPEQPDELNTPQAKELLEKARNAGYLDDRYQPKLSLTKSSILASVISFELELKDRWKPFEILWNRKNMRSNHSTAISQRNYNEFESEVIEALGLLRK